MSTYSHIALLFCGPRIKDELEPIWKKFLVGTEPFQVSYLLPPDARELVLKANREEHLIRHFDDSIVDTIVQETACHPHLIRILCSALIRILNEEERVKAYKTDIALALDKSFRSVSLYFESMWKELSDQERECLTELQKLKKATPDELANEMEIESTSIRRVLNTLTEKDIILYEQNVYRITVPMFVRWLERRVQ